MRNKRLMINPISYYHATDNVRRKNGAQPAQDSKALQYKIFFMIIEEKKSHRSSAAIADHFFPTFLRSRKRKVVTPYYDDKQRQNFGIFHSFYP